MNRDRERGNYLDSMQNMERWIIGTECPSLARQKREFQRVIKDSFESLIESESQQNNFPWRCVEMFYNVMKNDLDKIWSMRIFCTFVFKLFCTYDCEDHQLITKIIFMYHKMLNKYETLGFCANCMQLNNPRHYFYESLEDTPSIISKVNKITEKFYRYTNRELYSKFTIDSIYEGDYAFLMFSVKYGLSYFPDNELKEASDQLKRLFTLYCALTGRQRNDSEKGAFVESVLKQVFENESPNLIRIILILAYVLITVDKRLGDNYYPDYVNCLNLYVLTLSESEISLKDVEDFLSMAFTDDGTFISETCTIFQEVFPEIPRLSSPRPLKYLCRCTMRDHLKKFPSLPAVITGMGIPKKLKVYLLISSC